MQNAPIYPIVKLKCFPITKLQSVTILNSIKLKISLEYNSILNKRKSKATQKNTKTERKEFRMGGFFPEDFFLTGFFVREFFCGCKFSQGIFSMRIFP